MPAPDGAGRWWDRPRYAQRVGRVRADVDRPVIVLGVYSHISHAPASTGGNPDGYGAAHTDTLSQQVGLPAGCSSYTAAFWLHVDTAETGSTVFDTLTVSVLNTSGTVLATLATHSNANAATGYQQHAFSLANFAGQTVRLSFTGTEGSIKQTSFVLDDVTVTVA